MTDSNNNNNDMPQFPFFPNREQIRSFKRNIPVSVYDFYIVDEIKEPDAYLEMIQTLKSADPQDTIFIYLNTPGGNLYTTIQIMAAMTNSHAKVITCMEGQVCSAGTFIFLKGDAKLVNPHSTFMIHNYSQATSGKGNEIVSHINYMRQYFDKLAADVYKEFLSEEEINAVVYGNDLWMDSHEVVRRLDLYKHDYAYTGLDLDAKDEISVEVDPRGTMANPKPKKKRTTRKKKVATKKE